ncbi:MAG TPA: right-handed parallel beta-helix repeat-containing protein, partial [Actinomycetota bacterium]|nr:right-handed parallel beta-helix repeat-containing protein [Actinomycetota bacterium]
SNVDGNTVRFVDLLINDIGVHVTTRAQDNIVKENRFAGNSKQSVFLERVSGNRIDRNEIISTSGEGVLLEGANGNTVIDNFLESNSGGGIALALTSSGVPGNVGLPSNDNVIEGNSVYESGGPAIAVEGTSVALLIGNQLIDNIARDSSSDGISLDYSRDNLVKGNDVTANKGGISLSATTNSRLEGNIANEADADGIALENLSLSNELVDNEASYNLGDGIYVGVESTGSSGILIEGNKTLANTGYGIVVNKVAHIVKGNTANDNDSWGIWVSDGSNGRVNIDGGGNKAQGNVGATDPLTLKPLQCYGIQCEYGAPIGSDQIPPQTLLIEAPAIEDPDNKTTDPVSTFRFTGSDNASTVEFQCRLDYPAAAPQTDGWLACESPKEYGELGPGTHTFEVRALDVVGNVDASPVKYQWYISPLPSGENYPPQTTIESHPPEITVDTDATFAFTADEHASTFQCKLDTPAGAGLWATCSSPKVYAGPLAVGEHTFHVRARDVEGNLDPSPATLTWTITPPPVPREVTCGEIIVQSIILQNDLIDCIGHGIIVGTHGITIDLDGHVIDGTGIDAGILNNGHDSVTVKGGHIHEFDYGVQLNPGSSQNVVTGVRIENNQEAGIGLSDADQNGQGNTIRGNTITGNSWGVGLFAGSRHTVVRDNVFEVNQDDAVHMEGSSQVLVTGNDMVR